MVPTCGPSASVTDRERRTLPRGFSFGLAGGNRPAPRQGRGERRDGRWLGQQAELAGCGGSRGRPMEREVREPGHVRERAETAEQAGKGERIRPSG